MPKTEPRWVKTWIADLAVLNDRYRDDTGAVDFESLGREEYIFRMALISGRLDKSERARHAYEQAQKAVETSMTEESMKVVIDPSMK